MEINYPHSFSQRIASRYCEFRVMKRDRNNERIMLSGCMKANKETRYYSSLEEVLSSLNERMPPFFKGRFQLSKHGYVTLQLSSGEGMELSSFLQDLLGFDREGLLFEEGEAFENVSHESEENLSIVKATSKPDIQAAMYNIFIYCNLVRESLVGDVYVKLLRTVPVDSSQMGQYVTHSFENPRYMPLCSSFFQHIEIKMCNDLGSLLEFEWGKCILHLHLRRKSKILTSVV